MYSAIYSSVMLFLTYLGASLIWRIVNNRHLSPLRHIPGPLLASLTGRWLAFTDLAGQRTTKIHELHQKYGHAVRVGPNEVSFSDAESISEIYSQQTVYMKAPTYDAMTQKPAGIFAMRDKAQHSRRRALIGHAFAQSTLYDCETLITQQIQKLLTRIEHANGQPLDMLSMFRMLALDIIGVLFLGKSFGALESEKPIQFLHDADNLFLQLGFEENFPRMCQLLLWLPIQSLQEFFTSRQRILAYGRDAFFDYIDRYGRESGRRDLLTKILSNETNERSLDDVDTYKEVSNLVFAGTDTTSTTLTYLFWDLARFPEWQSRLHAELSSKLLSEKPLSAKDLADLPVLDALVNESLRLHPAAPASLARVVPPGGSTLQGHALPENTVVSAQCYTTQRDPCVFENPDMFDPERWLVPGGPSAEMKTMFMPFSRGSRVCLGKALALMELKLTTAFLVQRFVVRLAPGTTEDSMVMIDHFLAMPKGGKCDLIFSPRKSL